MSTFVQLEELMSSQMVSSLAERLQEPKLLSLTSLMRLIVMLVFWNGFGLDQTSKSDNVLI